MARKEMMRSTIWSCCAIGLGVWVAIAAFVGPSDSTARGDEKSSFTRILPELKYLGNPSCGGAQGCHALPPPVKPDWMNRIIGDELSIWEKADPHSNAVVSLTPAKSEIAKAIAAKEPGWLGGAKDFTSSAKCVACHTTNAPAHQVDKGWKNPLADAVGCEACHGPSQKWSVPHAKLKWADGIRKAAGPVPGGPKQAAAAFLAQGLLDTNYLATRAMTCVDCHLRIDPALLAAGHPPLIFEMYWYNSYFRKDPAAKKLQVHWNDRLGLKDGGELFNARLWAVGQAAGLEAATQQVNDWAAKGADTAAAKALAATYEAGVQVAKKHFGTADLYELSVAPLKLAAVQAAAVDLAATAPKATTVEARRIVAYGVIALVRAAWEEKNPTHKPGDIWKAEPDILKGYQGVVKLPVLEKGGAEFDALLKLMTDKVK